MLDTLSEYQECIFRLACFILYVYFPLFWIFLSEQVTCFFFFLDLATLILRLGMLILCYKTAVSYI